MFRKFIAVFAPLCISLLISALPASAAELTLMAVGDILPHPSWQGMAVPVDRLLSGVTEEFFKANVVVGNLETPLTDKADPTATKSPDALRLKKEFVFKCEDKGAAQCLKDAGFTVLTLANNHMLDYREAGLIDTLDRLKEAGIQASGAGADIDEAYAPCVVKQGDTTVVILTASDVVPVDYEARQDKPGIASMKDGPAFAERVKAVREEYPDALLVLCLHWGVEASLIPTARQKELAHRFIDAGADVIFGHHPHRLHGVEMYNGRPIFYSLGNFQFDSKLVYKPGSHKPSSVSLLPVLIENGGYPRLLKPKEPQYSAILKSIDEMSRPLGVALKGSSVASAPNKAEPSYY
jgi:hypothetical protein